MEIGVISWIVVGLIAGLLGKLIMPGRDPGGFLITIVIGMIGALVGGFVVQLLGGTGVTGFNIWSILVATLGAIILLASIGWSREGAELKPGWASLKEPESSYETPAQHRQLLRLISSQAALTS